MEKISVGPGMYTKNVCSIVHSIRTEVSCRIAMIRVRFVILGSDSDVLLNKDVAMGTSRRIANGTQQSRLFQALPNGSLLHCLHLSSRRRIDTFNQQDRLLHSSHFGSQQNLLRTIIPRRTNQPHGKRPMMRDGLPARLGGPRLRAGCIPRKARVISCLHKYPGCGDDSDR